MQQPANVEIISALKLALKSRGITYRQLSVTLGVSEKTIKRLFKDKNCSLSRLNEICKTINLPIYDLINFAHHYTEPSIKLTSNQELYLKEHAHHFAFLFFLITGHSLAKIQQTYQLSDLSIFRYLRDLDKQGLIELREENKYRLLIEGKLLVQLHSPLHELVRNASQQFLNYVIDHDGEKNTRFNTSFCYMAPEILARLNEELLALSQKYRKLSYQNEMVLPREQLIPVAWATLVAPYQRCGAWPLAELEQ